jgi:cytochrome c
MPRPDAKTLFRSLSLAALIQALPAGAGFTTPDCPDLKESEFKFTRLVTTETDPTLSEPIKLAVDLKEDGKPDVYFVERHGKVKRWNGSTNTVSVLAELDVWTDSPDKINQTGQTENGIEGIALDPDFRNNRRLYLRYEPWSKPVYRVSRFEVKGDKLDPASEKVLLDVPFVREHTHLQPIVLGGSGLIFDAHGDLYIALGANTELSPSVNENYRDFSAEYTASNLASLKGAILRIHPDDSPKGYSIPKGNFGEYFSDWFKQKGRDDLAAQYLDTAKVKPELYVKGVRNPYTLNVDPKRGWIVWGEFGPNRLDQLRIEEDNLATHPSFSGYPYWSGKNEFLLGALQPWGSMGMTPQAPVNASRWNEGPKELPPADTPRYAYSAYLYSGFLVGNHPTAGPIYRYDPASPSAIKLPPHFDGAWFVTDRVFGVRAFKLDETGSHVIDSTMLMTSQKMERPLDLKQGPDGALYVVDYGTGWHETTPETHTQIGRIEYTGSCHPGASTAILSSSGNATPMRVRFTASSVAVDEPGPHVVRLHDSRGREIGIWRGDGPMSHSLAAAKGRGLFFVTVELPKALRTFTLSGL